MTHVESILVDPQQQECVRLCQAALRGSSPTALQVEIGLEQVVRNYVFGRGGLAIDLATMVPVQLAAASSAHVATGFDALAFFSVMKLLRSVFMSEIMAFRDLWVGVWTFQGRDFRMHMWDKSACCARVHCD